MLSFRHLLIYSEKKLWGGEGRYWWMEMVALGIDRFLRIWHLFALLCSLQETGNMGYIRTQHSNERSCLQEYGEICANIQFVKFNSWNSIPSQKQFPIRPSSPDHSPSYPSNKKPLVELKSSFDLTSRFRAKEVPNAPYSPSISPRPARKGLLRQMNDWKDRDQNMQCNLRHNCQGSVQISLSRGIAMLGMDCGTPSISFLMNEPARHRNGSDLFLFCRTRASVRLCPSGEKDLSCRA